MSEREKKIQKPNEIVIFVKDIRGGLKILTPSQMLSRLPITLAQWKAGNNFENLKMKLDNYNILCTDQKNLQKNYMQVWLTLFKNGKNLYEHWK